MDVEKILNSYDNIAGWNDTIKLAVLTKYINGVHDEDIDLTRFEKFVRSCAIETGE